jgi:2-haloacid dehalogenase
MARMVVMCVAPLAGQSFRRHNWRMKRPTVILFDVNETLLDLSGVRAVLIEALGSADQLAEWFFRLLHGSLVANETDRFRSFESISVEALNAMAQRTGRDPGTLIADNLVGAFRTLPAHPEVPDALDQLRTAGFRLAALSNGSSVGIPAQLSSAGILDRFETTISVDEVGRFKPHAAPYRRALDRLGAAAGDVLMVAAHDWDILGARHVGMLGAFVARPGAVWSVPDAPAEIVGDNISAIADALEIM